MDKLRRSQDRNLRNASAIAYWELNNNRREDLPMESPPSYEESLKEPKQTTGKTGRVMISYQWDSQKIATKIRDDLVDSCFTVWLDLTDMRENKLYCNKS